mmetsp:Transcript_45479/g.131675  ORF Transcript_45479/g.131675 Transcript_45479/m.131675 type:complete len:311 (-) Transcript_45479:420-1352(-)
MACSFVKEDMPTPRDAFRSASHVLPTPRIVPIGKEVRLQEERHDRARRTPPHVEGAEEVPVANNDEVPLRSIEQFSLHVFVACPRGTHRCLGVPLQEVEGLVELQREVQRHAVGHVVPVIELTQDLQTVQFVGHPFSVVNEVRVDLDLNTGVAKGDDRRLYRPGHGCDDDHLDRTSGAGAEGVHPVGRLQEAQGPVHRLRRHKAILLVVVLGAEGLHKIKDLHALVEPWSGAGAFIQLDAVAVDAHAVVNDGLLRGLAVLRGPVLLARRVQSLHLCPFEEVSSKESGFHASRESGETEGIPRASLLHGLV